MATTAAMKPVQTAPALEKTLSEFGLAFLASDLRTIPKIERLTLTAYGQTMLANLGLGILRGNAKEEIRKDAIASFSNFGKIYDDYNKKFAELEKRSMSFFTKGARWDSNKKKSDDSGERTRSRLENAGLAFYYSMHNNKIVYKESTDFAHGMADKAIDCDLSAVLFNDLAKERGLPLAGGMVRKDGTYSHYVSVVMNKERMDFAVETTMLLKFDAADIYKVLDPSTLKWWKENEERFPTIKGLVDGKMDEKAEDLLISLTIYPINNLNLNEKKYQSITYSAGHYPGERDVLDCKAKNLVNEIMTMMAEGDQTTGKNGIEILNERKRKITEMKGAVKELYDKLHKINEWMNTLEK